MYPAKTLLPAPIAAHQPALPSTAAIASTESTISRTGA
jgi:hypothetical protein